MIRVGWTHYEGGLTLDDRFVQNIEGANAAGIPAGVYAYGYDLSPGAARISAAQVIEAVKPYRLEYPVCYDQEYEEVLMALSRAAISSLTALALAARAVSTFSVRSLKSVRRIRSSLSQEGSL